MTGSGHMRGAGIASAKQSGFVANRAYGAYDKAKPTGIKLKLGYKGHKRPKPTLPVTPFDWKSEDPVTSAPPLPTAEADEQWDGRKGKVRA